MIAIPKATTQRQCGLGLCAPYLLEVIIRILLVRLNSFSNLWWSSAGCVPCFDTERITRKPHKALSRGSWTYRIWWLERSGLCGELRNAVGGAFDSEFFHPMSQGVRMHAESSGGAVRTLNHTACLL